MRIVNISEAKTNFTKLLEEVVKGNVVLIAKSGIPMAKLTCISSTRPIRKPGFLKGKIKIASDFDSRLPDDLLNAFEGK
jgi:prevent-host-death family protein